MPSITPSATNHSGSLKKPTAVTYRAQKHSGMTLAPNFTSKVRPRASFTNTFGLVALRSRLIIGTGAVGASEQGDGPQVQCAAESRPGSRHSNFGPRRSAAASGKASASQSTPNFTGLLATPIAVQTPA